VTPGGEVSLISFFFSSYSKILFSVSFLICC